MLNNISRQIKDCYDRAAQCEQRARQATGAEYRRDLLDAAKRWRVLARSYEFTEQLERFTYKPTKADQHKI